MFLHQVETVPAVSYGNISYAISTFIVSDASKNLQIPALWIQISLKKNLSKHKAMLHYLYMIFFFSERITTSWDPVKRMHSDLGISLWKGIHQLHSSFMSRQKQVISQLLPLPHLSAGEVKLGSLGWEEVGCAHILILDLGTCYGAHQCYSSDTD